MAGFTKAIKHESKGRIALCGPAGSGKTYTALVAATRLAEGKPIAVIDTERGSASKYADLFAFDVMELQSHHPLRYVEAITEAAKAGYAVLVIDSISHAWMGKDGALEMVDRAAKRSSSGNSYVAWRDVTPLHNQMVDAMVSAPLHVIVTMRSKTEYVQEKDEKGKTTIRKVGMAPIQRDGLEYEFDLVGDLDWENTWVISKTRCPQYHQGVFSKPTPETFAVFAAWLSGLPAPAKPAPAPSQGPAPQTTANGRPEHRATIATKEDAEEAARMEEQTPFDTNDATALSFEELEAGLNAAATDDALTTISDQIKAAKSAQSITTDQYWALVKLGKVRRAGVKSNKQEALI
ncbi:MAG: ATP-binding protein [Gemmatimonadaceae bacterium]|nr:ATP-binding protein [Gemmatimonadaceae bacterium]